MVEQLQLPFVPIRLNVILKSDCLCFCLQKARLARIQIAKATSGAAFVSKKKAAEARMAERAANGQPEIDNSGKEDIFEMQHHHLLRCLEKTTVSHKSIAIHVNLMLNAEVLKEVFPTTYIGFK